MKTVKAMIVAMLVPAMLWGQNFSDVLSMVESNNTTLQALRQQTMASKAEARTGIAPENPEVEVGYLWGDPAEMGNRFDLNVTQSFDFPTAYVWRSRIASGQADMADVEYLVGRREILLEAWSACIEVVYRNSMKAALGSCLANAVSIDEEWKAKAAAGEASALDVNKANLSLLMARKTYDENEIELEAALNELARLNGGEPVLIETASLMPVCLPEDFDAWFEDACRRAPEMTLAAKKGKMAEMELNLAKTGWLPKFNLGYVSERIAGTTLQGVAAGVSIPLWANHGRVKAAKAQADAARLVAEDGLIQFRSGMKTLYSKGVKLQSIVDGYRHSLREIDSMDMLRKALEAGEMSVLDYMLEQEVWLDAFMATLESDRDLHLIWAEMQSYVL